MNFNFLVDELLLQIKDVLVDVILATNIKEKCDKKYMIKQAFSATFSKSSNVINLIKKALHSLRKSWLYIRFKVKCPS